MANKLTLVIPCCNEADRLPFAEFAAFQEEHPEIRFCFVNDGSTDRTLRKLKEFERRYPRSVTVVSLEQNRGKAEAVRQGVLQGIPETDGPEYFGFWDADLATPLAEAVSFVNRLDAAPELEAVIGSRWPRLGARIDRTPLRGVAGRCMSTLFSGYLGVTLYDSQCGAKVFRSGVGRGLFRAPFVSRWLFDIELLQRVSLFYSPAYLRCRIQEYPLPEWRDVRGSKLRCHDFGRILFEFLRIIWFYRRRIRIRNLQDSGREPELLI